MKFYFLLLLIFTLAFFSAAGQTREPRVFTEKIIEREFFGKVIEVHDGETCMVLDEKRKLWKIRLVGIEAPKLTQPFGARSKQYLSNMIFGKEVTIISGKIDKYGRTSGKVLISGVNINLEQIKSGMAWHDKKYQLEQSPEDRTAYALAETRAKSKKIGVWSEKLVEPLIPNKPKRPRKALKKLSVSIFWERAAHFDNQYFTVNFICKEGSAA